MKIVINRCWGGFSLSDAACKKLNCRPYDYDQDDLRCAPELVQVVEELGTEAASGDFSRLKVVEVPDDMRWYIDNYDGMESVEEKHRSWY